MSEELTERERELLLASAQERKLSPVATERLLEMATRRKAAGASPPRFASDPDDMSEKGFKDDTYSGSAITGPGWQLHGIKLYFDGDSLRIVDANEDTAELSTTALEALCRWTHSHNASTPAGWVCLHGYEWFRFDNDAVTLRDMYGATVLLELDVLNALCAWAEEQGLA